MFRALLLVALAFAAVSAQRWPMITVNANGEIVLQSLTRATALQITPTTVTTAPTSTGTASLSTATQLAAGTSLYSVTATSSPASGHGVTLPSPSVGATVTFVSGSTTFVSYTIYTSATSVYLNSDSTYSTFVASSRRTVCQAVSVTRWNCLNDAVDTAFAFLQNPIISLTSTTAYTANVLQSGSTFTNTVTATAVTLPTCAAANVGTWFRFASVVGGTATQITVTLASGDKAVGVYIAATTTTAAALAAGGSLALKSAATWGSAASVVDVTFTCQSANSWLVEGQTGA